MRAQQVGKGAAVLFFVGWGVAAALGAAGCGDDVLAASDETPSVPHGPPNEEAAASETCVACHACGVDGAPLIDRAHSICTECHGPAPEFVAEVPDGGGCGFRMDCSTTPPEVNCFGACHDHTVRQVNAMCEQCHAYSPPAL